MDNWKGWQVDSWQGWVSTSAPPSLPGPPIVITLGIGAPVDLAAFVLTGLTVYIPTPPVPDMGGASIRYITTPPVALKYDDDDDLFLAAWMLFMRQPYRKE